MPKKSIHAPQQPFKRLHHGLSNLHGQKYTKPYIMLPARVERNLRKLSTLLPRTSVLLVMMMKINYIR